MESLAFLKHLQTLLDYTVDSDDEWEEEEPGESLSDCHSAVSMVLALAG